MRPTDDIAGEQDVQAYLNRANRRQRINHQDTAFLVYTDDKGGNVIGDQYMWHYLYPLLRNWISDELEPWLPCKPCWNFIDCCSTGIMAKKRNGDTLGFRTFAFAPDFPIVRTPAELEAQFPKLKISLIGCIPEMSSPDFTRLTMDNREGKLKARYPFAVFRMSIYKVPDAKLQALSQTTAYSLSDFDGREVCRADFTN